MCEDVQHVGALNELNPRMHENECISCGQCIHICPTNALKETNDTSMVLRALSAGKILVLQTAPAVRVAVGENFGDPVGTNVTGKIVSAARMMGFKYVVDTNFTADMTILEEGGEFLERLTNNGTFPMFSSCCPAWINFVEKHHPELIPNLSTCKSPHMMLGRAIKIYYSQKLKVDESKIFVCSLMPCVAKKDEIRRMQLSGDVDCVLTSKEFGLLVNEFQIDWSILKPSEFDSPFGEGTGGAVIFGASGGVTEAVARYVWELKTGKPPGRLQFEAVRGFTSIKKATLTFGDTTLNIAICSGIGAAREIIESGELNNFQFIEVMSCPGGCINGGGQPKLANRELAKQRMASIYKIDEETPEMTSHHNKSLLQFYEEFIGKPGCHKAHTYFHTHYEPQETAYLANKKRMLSMPFVGYGSGSGTAMGFARNIAGFINSTSQALNNLSIPQLIKRGTAIIVCSTIGDGEFPSNMSKFAELLEKSEEDLSSVKFAICGIGSSSYRRFCNAGKTLNELMLKHKAVPLIPLETIDTSKGDHGESAFEIWSGKVCQALNLPPPKIDAKIIFTVTPDEDDSVIETPYKPVGFDFADIIENFQITPDNYDPALNRFTFNLPPKMSYETGDHCAILPRNDPSIVDKVIKALGFNPQQVYSVRTIGKIDTLIPSKVTVQELFSQYLDLNGRIDRSLIRCFIHIADEKGQAELNRLIDPANEAELTELSNTVNIGEFILDSLKYGKPSLELIMSCCPKIKPRLYSISSSHLKDRSHLELTIANLLFGKGKHGLCTHYLNSMRPSKVLMHTQRGAFRYPKDAGTPIVMACLGAGIAPMIALMQHRESFSPGTFGKAIIYFGARNRAGYVKVEELFQSYKDKGIIDEFHIAYSRDGPKKVYITDQMGGDIDKLWDYWKDPRAEFFYCGPPRGIPETLLGIMDKVVEKGQNVSNEEAKEVNKKHKFWMEAY